jgi:hypothetical protein
VEQDFTSPVTYTVTVADGSTAGYIVTVSPPPDGKTITDFRFTSPPATGTISGMNITVTVTRMLSSVKEIRDFRFVSPVRAKGPSKAQTSPSRFPPVRL